MVKRRYNSKRRPRPARPIAPGTTSGERHVEVFTFSTTVGLSQPIPATVLNLPASRSWRLFELEFEVVGGYVPGVLALPGFWAPAACQFNIISGTTNSQSVASSPVHVLGHSPRRVILRNPPSEDWQPPGPGAGVIGRIDAVCLGSPGIAAQVAYLRGVCRATVFLKPEIVGTVCPGDAQFVHLGEPENGSHPFVLLGN